MYVFFNIKRGLAFPAQNLTTFFFPSIYIFSTSFYTESEKSQKTRSRCTIFRRPGSPFPAFPPPCVGVNRVRSRYANPRRAKRSLGGLFSQESIIYLCGGGGVSLRPHIWASGLSQHGREENTHALTQVKCIAEISSGVLA